MTRAQFKSICDSIFPGCLFDEWEDRCSVFSPTLLSTMMTVWLNEKDEVIKMTNDYPKGQYKVKISEENVIKKLTWNKSAYRDISYD
jgi:hypothetical protein